MDEENGCFRFLPQADLARFLNDPMTGAIYLRYFCIPFFKTHDLDYCKQVASNPSVIH